MVDAIDFVGGELVRRGIVQPADGPGDEDPRESEAAR